MAAFGTRPSIHEIVNADADAAGLISHTELR